MEKPIALAAMMIACVACVGCGSAVEASLDAPDAGLALTDSEAEVEADSHKDITGRFTTLAYNIAGLLEPFSSSNPSENTPIISCLIRDYDIVNVQEDFNYHAALYDSCDDHPHRSSTSGGMGFGSGLNLLSRFPYIDWDRLTWNNRSGSDALTPKGFTIARVRLAEGVYVDVYNLHAQSGTTEEALANSRSNILQLLSYIEVNSAGNAIIVMGDTNTRYTRAGQNIRLMLRHGFSDVWIDLLRGGAVPAAGSAALTSCATPTSAGCEIVDKVFYRNSRFVTLTPTVYKVENERFVDANGEALSDHWPVRVSWDFRTDDRFRMSDSFGGPHSVNFNDVALLPGNPVVSSISLRTGSRVDGVGVRLSNGWPLVHGGTGGTLQTLTLGSTEHLTSAYLCSDTRNGLTRIFHARFTTNTGRSISGGNTTDDCVTYTAPSGWQIVGFFGRSGDEIDRLGLVYSRRTPGPAPGAPPYPLFVNRHSGLCMDIQGIVMAPGTNVWQWDCTAGPWQRWNHDAETGLIRSQQDPRYCLDTTNHYGDGADLIIWTCNGNANQLFTIDGNGAIRKRTFPEQALDDHNFGTAWGAEIVTWTDWGGDNQRWDVVP